MNKSCYPFTTSPEKLTINNESTHILMDIALFLSWKQKLLHSRQSRCDMCAKLAYQKHKPDIRMDISGS